LLHSPRIEGWAERRETFGCVRSTRWTRHLASKTRVNALMTRRVRRLARRLASRDAGRSPLGAPPWRFFTRGRASVSGITRIRPASSSQPGRSAWRATSRASWGERLRATRQQDATPRSAFRIVSGDAPHERGCESCSTGALRSQYLHPVRSRRSEPTRRSDASAACPVRGE
jgi:hypothetical protein